MLLDEKALRGTAKAAARRKTGVHAIQTAAGQQPHRLPRTRRDVDALPGQHERLQLVDHLQRPRLAQILLAKPRSAFASD